MLYFRLQEGIPEGLLDGVSVGTDGANEWGEVVGGDVASAVILNGLDAYRKRDSGIGPKIATFKKRFSKTVGEAYLSQGCPKCDVLWGDYPQQELALRYAEDIAGERHGGSVLFAFPVVCA